MYFVEFLRLSLTQRKLNCTNVRIECFILLHGCHKAYD